MDNHSKKVRGQTIFSKYNKVFLAVSLVLVLPVMVFAVDFVDLSKPENANLTNFVNNFIKVLNYLVPFITGFSFFGFVTGVLKYVNAGGDSERLGQGKQFMIYGLIGLLVVFSYWGLAKLIANSYFSVGV